MSNCSKFTLHDSQLHVNINSCRLVNWLKRENRKKKHDEKYYETARAIKQFPYSTAATFNLHRNCKQKWQNGRSTISFIKNQTFGFIVYRSII